MEKSRIEWIDLVRAIAILTVLYCHSVDGIYIILSDATTYFTLGSRIFQFISLFIGRMGVPFFLMITGYILLDRMRNPEYNQQQYFKEGGRKHAAYASQQPIQYDAAGVFVRAFLAHPYKIAAWTNTSFTPHFYIREGYFHEAGDHFRTLRGGQDDGGTGIGRKDRTSAVSQSYDH